MHMIATVYATGALPTTTILYYYYYHSMAKSHYNCNDTDGDRNFLWSNNIEL